jgi:hypothetical protein
MVMFLAGRACGGDDVEINVTLSIGGFGLVRATRGGPWRRWGVARAGGAAGWGSGGYVLHFTKDSGDSGVVLDGAGRAVGALAVSVRRVLDGGGKAAASGWLRACKTLAFKMKMVLGTDENEHISYLPVIIGCGAAQSGEMRCGYSSWKTTRTWRVSL